MACTGSEIKCVRSGLDSPSPSLAGHGGTYLGDGLVLSAIDPQVGPVHR